MSFVISLGTAFWFGILTSISPCPLATNIAAVSYLSNKIVHVRAVLISGIAYTLGRMLVEAEKRHRSKLVFDTIEEKLNQKASA